ncbi:TBC1 domain family member 20 [Nilaparvata lugens]|uniref:TBC1 domain family member 20 n=1 Tax=Nilaparvata lugens TaxID=108931 RepID=UPI00193E22E5|nr:TBC1 domain family member 20 [Nilaparvata lugens]
MPGLDDIANEEENELLFIDEILTDDLLEKVTNIEKVLDSSISDEEKFDALTNFAKTDGGLVKDSVRKKVWPKLLGVDTSKIEPFRDHSSLVEHAEYEQVVLDVKRSLKRFPPSIPYEERLALQDQLTQLIMRVIIEYPHLRYYQGYHDVAVTILLVVGEDAAFQIMKVLSTNHLKDFMERTMEKTQYLLNHIYPLIKRRSPKLYEFLEKAELGTMFCLPWFLTWYGHDLKHYRDVVRLYDFFLASPPLMSLYLAAAIVLYRQQDILSVECDMAAIHSLLAQLPDEMPFDKLLSEASKLYSEYPPKSLEKEVEERFQLELEMRRPVSKRRAAARGGVGGRGRVSLWIVLMGVRRMAARQPVKTLLFTVSLAVGLFAYLRSETLDFMLQFYSIR